MKANKRKFTILDGLSGRVVPGRMTLLLGPPGSGKTTLLSALAGKLRHSELQAWPLHPLLYIQLVTPTCCCCGNNTCHSALMQTHVARSSDYSID